MAVEFDRNGSQALFPVRPAAVDLIVFNPEPSRPGFTCDPKTWTRSTKPSPPPGFPSNSTVERTRSRRSLLPWQESDRQYPSDRHPSHHASRYPMSLPPSHTAYDVGPIYQDTAPPAPRLARVSTCISLAAFSATRVFIKVGNPSQSPRGSFLRLRRHDFETMESAVLNASQVSVCRAATDRHEHHAWPVLLMNKHGGAAAPGDPLVMHDLEKVRLRDTDPTIIVLQGSTIWALNSACDISRCMGGNGKKCHGAHDSKMHQNDVESWRSA